jgi:hypothetical protein
MQSPLHRSPELALLGLSDVTRIARQTVFDHALPFEIAGVLRSGPGSGYVELLVTSDACSSGPFQALIGVFRNLSETSLITDIASRLRRLHEKDRSSPS